MLLQQTECNSVKNTELILRETSKPEERSNLSSPRIIYAVFRVDINSSLLWFPLHIQNSHHHTFLPNLTSKCWYAAKLKSLCHVQTNDNNEPYGTDCEYSAALFRHSNTEVAYVITTQSYVPYEGGKCRVKTPWE